MKKIFNFKARLKISFYINPIESPPYWTIAGIGGTHRIYPPMPIITYDDYKYMGCMYVDTKLNLKSLDVNTPQHYRKPYKNSLIPAKNQYIHIVLNDSNKEIEKYCDSFKLNKYKFLFGDFDMKTKIYEVKLYCSNDDKEIIENIMTNYKMETLLNMI